MLAILHTETMSGLNNSGYLFFVKTNRKLKLVNILINATVIKLPLYLKNKTFNTIQLIKLKA